MFMHKVIDNVLPEDIFQVFKRKCRNAVYKDIPAGMGDTLRLAKPDPLIVDFILKEISKSLCMKLRVIISFARLNHNNVNNTFRVHSDTLIEGEKPDIAAVFYFDTVVNTGTALFKHPEYGLINGNPSQSLIFKDNELWEPYLKYESKANSAFIYNADLYHGRYPWEAYGTSQKDGRIVLVMFLKEVK